MHTTHVAKMDRLLNTVKNRKTSYNDVVANKEEILAKHNELEQCKRVEMALQGDIADGVISAEEYGIFKDNIARKCEEIRGNIRKLQKETELILKEGLAANEWIDTFTKTGNITSLDRSTVLSLIENIMVYEENRIKITFKYQDGYETLCRIDRTLPGKCGSL